MEAIKRHKKSLSLTLIGLLIIGLPVIVLVAQMQQEQRSRATDATTLYLQPNSSESAPLQKTVGDTVSFDVMLNPGDKLPSLVKLELTYDETKLQPLPNNAFVANTTAFPQTIEGPLLNNNAVMVSLSIGSDSTKAIRETTKVGTVSFTTLAPTTSATSVSFGPRSQILSLSQNVQSTANVLSTSTAGYVSIASNIPSSTIVPTTEQPTVAPTTVPTVLPTTESSPTIIVTTIPTIESTIQPTTATSPTLVPSSLSTKLDLTVFMHGIGKSGDNVNPDEHDMSNKNPKRPTRPMEVFVYNASNKLVASSSGVLTYASSSGNFKGSVELPNFSQGSYTVKVFSPDHLRKFVGNILNLKPLQTNTLPATTLIAGDVTNDNIINILDYNVLVGCYSDLEPPASCTPEKKLASDLNDDGFVNQFDYNMFLREISVQEGN